jgi:DNA-binding response OmpR family regulator
MNLMSFYKYKDFLFQKINRQLSLWFESEGNVLIPNDEVYQFLHSVYETSGTLQLTGLSQLSGRLMREIKESSGRNWGKEDLQNALDELITMTYKYENFDEIQQDLLPVREGNIPLIQIIDEDISTLILLKEALEHHGWVVIANTNTERALSQYLELTPDCIILDTMESLNGFQILNELQNYVQQPFVPIIMTSIYRDRDTRIKAYRNGADDFIEKPIDVEELIVRTERLISRKKRFDEAVIKAQNSGQLDIGMQEEPIEAQGKKPLFVSIIDDDAIVRSMLLKILKSMDIAHYELQLETFVNGIQFFESKRLYEKGKHFLILDGVMPVMDGIEILQKVRSLDLKEEDLYILMLTGRKTDTDIEKALRLGADDYLTKPFSIKELQARIQRLIKRMK